ncbi:MAG: ABC transporter ATP-binding protein [Lachnospiraceae bacterium]|nr:ABC transporter ATP-binding protein [Lachnospiraceae bacterium]
MSQKQSSVKEKAKGTEKKDFNEHNGSNDNSNTKVKPVKYNLISNIIYVYKGVAKHKPYLIALLFPAVFCTALSKFIWLFLGKDLVSSIEQGIMSDQLIQRIVILTVINLICMIGQNAVIFGKEPAAFYVRPMFMLKRNLKSIGMFYENLEEREVLDAMERSRASTRNVDVGIEGIIRFTVDFCMNIFTCILAVFLLCRISPLLAVLVLLCGVFEYLSVDHATKKEKILTNDSVLYEKNKLEFFKKSSSDFAYGKDIRLLGIAPKLLETQEELHATLNRQAKKAGVEWIKSGLFNNLLGLFREALLYGVLVVLILNGNLGIGDFLLYAGCVHNLADAFMNIMRTVAKLRKCSKEVNDYRSLNEFCDELEESGKDVPGIKDQPEQTMISENKKTSDDTGIASSNETSNGTTPYNIKFENVSFRYPGAETSALKNVNLTLRYGEKLAVVGLNGAGKTTFVKLLLKLYKPCEGRILLNGTDISELDTKQYYRLFAPVFQDMECYAFTLAENISMKTEAETDKARVKECLEMAGLGDKLKTYEKGVDSPMLRILHNDGIMLSGGEKQKMALARALYKDAPLVVLDEPTAALDALAESELYERFDRLVNGKSAVYVSHRLSSTRFCDHVAMFEGGELVEYGTHTELMERKGKYAEMFELQAQYYREDQNKDTEEYGMCS